MMDQQMTQNAWAIGLYNYSAPHPGADGLKQFFELINSIYRDIGISPSYFAAEGEGYSGDLTKFGGRVHTRAIRSGFTDIDALSIVANPDGSSEPAYDSFASASLGYVAETGETLLCLTVEERFLQFGSSAFERILKSLVALQSWDFGYGLSQPIEKKPEFHVLGLDGGKLSAKERGKLNAWYASLPEERLRRIRDVYPFNVVSDLQLGTQVSASQTLGDVIRQDPNSSLSALKSGLWLWGLRNDAIAAMRERLLGSGVLIS